MPRALHDLPQPVVVAIEGACVGAGLALALCADVRVASEGARFATAFTGIALAADSGLSASLARAVGPSRAAALFLLGDRFGAQEGLDWGLLHRSSPTARPLTRQGLRPADWHKGPLLRTARSKGCCGIVQVRTWNARSPPRQRRRRSWALHRITTRPRQRS